MVEALRNSLVPLLLAGGLLALGGCSGYSSNNSGYRAEAATTPYPYGESSAPKPYYGNPAYGNPACPVGPTAGNNPACDTLQDQGAVRR